MASDPICVQERIPQRRAHRLRCRLLRIQAESVSCLQRLCLHWPGPIILDASRGISSPSGGHQARTSWKSVTLVLSPCHLPGPSLNLHPFLWTPTGRDYEPISGRRHSALGDTTSFHEIPHPGSAKEDSGSVPNPDSILTPLG